MTHWITCHPTTRILADGTRTPPVDAVCLIKQRLGVK